MSNNISTGNVSEAVTKVWNDRKEKVKTLWKDRFGDFEIMYNRLKEFYNEELIGRELNVQYFLKFRHWLEEMNSPYQILVYTHYRSRTKKIFFIDEQDVLLLYKYRLMFLKQYSWVQSVNFVTNKLLELLEKEKTTLVQLTPTMILGKSEEIKHNARKGTYLMNTEKILELVQNETGQKTCYDEIREAREAKIKNRWPAAEITHPLFQKILDETSKKRKWKDKTTNARRSVYIQLERFLEARQFTFDLESTNADDFIAVLHAFVSQRREGIDHRNLIVYQILGYLFEHTNYLPAREEYLRSIFDDFNEYFKYKSNNRRVKEPILFERWDEIILRSGHRSTQLAIYLMFYYGLRLGEVTHLRYTDVDLERRRLIIQHHLEDKTLGIERWSPKGTSDRELPIRKSDTVLFHTHIQWHQARFTTSYLIVDGDGKRMKEENLSSHIRAFRQEDDPFPIRAHIMRFSFASHAYFVKKWPLKKVSRALGHKYTTTTEDYLLLHEKEIEDDWEDLYD